MALLGLAHSSIYGPNNPGNKTTGNIQGPNIVPLENFALGNPLYGGTQLNSLVAGANASLYGPTIAAGRPGASFIPDVYGNIPSELS